MEKNLDKNIYKVPKYCAICMGILGLPAACLGGYWQAPLKLAVFGYGMGIIAYGIGKLMIKYTNEYAENQTCTRLGSYKKSLITQWYRQGIIGPNIYEKLIREVEDAKV